MVRNAVGSSSMMPSPSLSLLDMKMKTSRAAVVWTTHLTCGLWTVVNGRAHGRTQNQVDRGSRSTSMAEWPLCVRALSRPRSGRSDATGGTWPDSCMCAAGTGRGGGGVGVTEGPVTPTGSVHVHPVLERFTHFLAELRATPTSTWLRKSFAFTSSFRFRVT